MYVSAGIMSVRVCTHDCGLTNDGVSSHFLAYHCRIAAQEHWKWGHIWPCVPLTVRDYEEEEQHY